MKITVNEVPLSKNKYINMRCRNFKAQLAKRKQYKEMISWLIYEQYHKLFNDPKYVDDIGDFAEKVTITFDIYFKCKRRRDVQN